MCEVGDLLAGKGLRLGSGLEGFQGPARVAKLC